MEGCHYKGVQSPSVTGSASYHSRGAVHLNKNLYIGQGYTHHIEGCQYMHCSRGPVWPTSFQKEPRSLD